MSNPKPKILLYDIEIAGNFGANAGYVLCVGYKWLGDKSVNLITIRDSKTFKKDCTDDRYVLEKFAPIYEQADAAVGWYSSKFDFKFLQTRCLLNGLLPLPYVPEIDGWKEAKYGLKFTRNSLDIVARALKASDEKTHLDFGVWMKAAAGHVQSIKYIETHCIQDVKVLEQVYKKMRPFIRKHPNLGLLRDDRQLAKSTGCPNCGADHVMSKGLAAGHMTVKRRYVCLECGANFYTGVTKRVGKEK